MHVVGLLSLVYRDLFKARVLTWMILCMWGISRSIRTSSSITNALQTFFRTSGSSSTAKANKCCQEWGKIILSHESNAIFNNWVNTWFSKDCCSLERKSSLLCRKSVFFVINTEMQLFHMQLKPSASSISNKWTHGENEVSKAKRSVYRKKTEKFQAYCWLYTLWIFKFFTNTVCVFSSTEVAQDSKTVTSVYIVEAILYLSKFRELRTKYLSSLYCTLFSKVASDYGYVTAVKLLKHRKLRMQMLKSLSSFKKSF